MKGEIRTYIQICLYLHGETLGKTHKKLKRPFLGRRWIGWAEVGGRGRKVRLLWQKAEEREAGGGGQGLTQRRVAASKEQNPQAQSQGLWLLQFLQPQSEIQVLSPASFCLDGHIKIPCSSTSHPLLGRDCQLITPYACSSSSLTNKLQLLQLFPRPQCGALLNNCFLGSSAIGGAL